MFKKTTRAFTGINGGFATNSNLQGQYGQEFWSTIQLYVISIVIRQPRVFMTVSIPSWYAMTLNFG